MADKQWTVGWKPIDQASAEPKWSGVQFDCFNDADRAAKALNASDPEHHYFPSLLNGVLDKCTECGRLVDKAEMKPNPYPNEKGQVCNACYLNGVELMEANPTGVG